MDYGTMALMRDEVMLISDGVIESEHNNGKYLSKVYSKHLTIYEKIT